MMRKIKRPKIGEYVLLSRWSDKDMQDPWHIGNLVEVGEDTRGMFYKVFDHDLQCPSNYYRHCHRLTVEEGREWLKFAESIGRIRHRGLEMVKAGLLPSEGGEDAK